jgi:hypothetical protein
MGGICDCGTWLMVKWLADLRAFRSRGMHEACTNKFLRIFSRACLWDCAIWTGSVDNLFSLACSKLSSIGCRSIVGGVLIGRWTSRGVGGKSTRADGLVVEWWLASLQRFKQAWRAGECHLAQRIASNLRDPSAPRLLICNLF